MLRECMEKPEMRQSWEVALAGAVSQTGASYQLRVSSRTARSWQGWCRSTEVSLEVPLHCPWCRAVPSEVDLVQTLIMS